MEPALSQAEGTGGPPHKLVLRLRHSLLTSAGGSSNIFLENSDGSLLKLAGELASASIGTQNDFSLDILTNNFSRIRVASSGSVGIGTTSPQDLLHVNGVVRLESVNDLSGSCILNCPSDARLKQNIESLGPVLERLVRLEPVSFDYRVDDYPQLHLGTGHTLGLVAQQVEEVLPDLVGVRQDGFKMVKYHELPVLLLEAIQELKAENDRLKQELSTRIGSLEAELAALKAVLEEQNAVKLAAARPE
jgi:hypothetical protein